MDIQIDFYSCRGDTQINLVKKQMPENSITALAVLKSTDYGFGSIACSEVCGTNQKISLFPDKMV